MTGVDGANKSEQPVTIEQLARDMWAMQFQKWLGGSQKYPPPLNTFRAYMQHTRQGNNLVLNKRKEPEENMTHQECQDALKRNACFSIYALNPMLAWL